MRKFILGVSMAFSVQVFSQTNCDIQNHYGDFIKITKKTYNGKEYFNYPVVRVDSRYCFADYVNNNIKYIEYFIESFFPNKKKDDLLKIDDSLTLQSAFNAVMQEDSLFNAVMLELTAKVIDKTIPKDTITMNTLLNIAVKYFYVWKITEDTAYSYKLCSWFNGIRETEPVRKPFIEAFAFFSIFTDYFNPKYNIHNELENAIRELYKMNLGVDKEERLLRARGAVFMYMLHNQKLRDLLLYEYENKKEYLPFVLRDI